MDNIALHRSGSSIHCSYSGRQNEQTREKYGGQERWRRRWCFDPVRSCRAGRWWRNEILPPFPSIHPWSSLAKGGQNEGWSLVWRQPNREHFTPLIIKPLHYTYIVHTRAGCNSASLWVTHVHLLLCLQQYGHNTIKRSLKIGNINCIIQNKDNHFCRRCIAPNPGTDTEKQCHANFNRTRKKPISIYTNQKMKQYAFKPRPKCTLFVFWRHGLKMCII